MKTVLVTGGAGFIGSHLVDALLARGDRVLCVDNFNEYYDPATKERNVAPFTDNENFKLYKADITDSEKMKEIFASEQIDAVAHLAGRAGVRPSLEDPELYARVNVQGTTNLLQCAADNKITHFVFASSSSVYGNSDNPPFAEDDPINRPISPYATTKRACELMCATYNHLYGMNTICLRFFTVFGPKGRPDMAPYLFSKAILEGKPIRKFGKGDSKRDYTYIGDIIQGVVAAIDATHLSYEIINLGNQKPHTLNDFIATIEEVIGKKAEIIQEGTKPGDVKLTCAKIDKAKELLGYNPKTPLKEGLQHFIEWYKNEKNL